MNYWIIAIREATNKSALRMHAHFVAVFFPGRLRQANKKPKFVRWEGKSEMVRHLNWAFSIPRWRRREKRHQQMHGEMRKRACEKAVRGFSIARFAHININIGYDYAKNEKCAERRQSEKGKVLHVWFYWLFPAINFPVGSGWSLPSEMVTVWKKFLQLQK